MFPFQTFFNQIVLLTLTTLICGHRGQQSSSESIKVTSLLLPKNCTTFSSPNQLRITQNIVKNPKIQVSRTRIPTNETILNILNDGNSLFVITRTKLLQIKNNQVIGTVGYPQNVEANNSYSIRLVNQSELILICSDFKCLTFSMKNISETKLIEINESIGLNTKYSFDQTALYNYIPVGKWLINEDKVGVCNQVNRKYLNVDEVKLFDSNIKYFDVVYHFEYLKSTFLIQYKDNVLTLIQTNEFNSDEVIETKTNYALIGPVVSVYFHQSDEKLYVVTRSKTDLHIGTIDTKNNSRNAYKLLQKLPFKSFQEFVVLNDKMIFNLGKQIVSLEDNVLTLINENNNHDFNLINPINSNEDEISYFTLNMMFTTKFPRKSKSTTSSKVALYSSITGLILIIIILLLAGIVIKRKRQSSSKSAINGRYIGCELNPISTKKEEIKFDPSQFSNQPIFIFNESLSEIVVLSKGAFGEVCKGLYDDGHGHKQVVAIKSLFRFNAEKLKQEADIACSLRHSNVLSLIGICFDVNNQQLKLVLPFMVNGDLASFMDKLWIRKSKHEDGDGYERVNNNDGQEVELNGILLKSFSLQITNGMIYLISEDQGHPSIIHRDLAARNVMVDADLTLKVADFGLSRHLDTNKKSAIRSHQTSLIPSTSAPESIRNLIFNEKSDVWSFGSLLLELYDENINTVPEEVLNLSDLCHSYDPELRPSFADIQDKVNELSVVDFEPIICDDDAKDVDLASSRAKDTSMYAKDKKLLEMIQEAPNVDNEEVEEDVNIVIARKESIDEPFDDATSSLVQSFSQKRRQQMLIKKALVNGYCNNGVINDTLLEEKSSYSNLADALHDDDDISCSYSNIPADLDAFTESTHKVSQDQYVPMNGYFNFGHSN